MNFDVFTLLVLNYGGRLIASVCRLLSFYLMDKILIKKSYTVPVLSLDSKNKLGEFWVTRTSKGTRTILNESEEQES